MTTPDEAQALLPVTPERPLSEHPCWWPTLEKIGHRHHFWNDELQPDCERCGTQIDSNHKQVDGAPLLWRNERLERLLAHRAAHTDKAIAALARQSLGEWLAWPDAPRDGPREVDNEQVRSWLSGLPNKLASLTNEAARHRQSHSFPGDVGMRSAVERFLADYDDGDRADAGVHPLMEAHIADFRAALTPSPCPGGVGLREALEKCAAGLEGLSAQNAADPLLQDWADGLAATARAALTPSALSGDAGEGETQITLSEYELRNIDELISAHAILGGDHYDTLWNLRNRIKPFVEGDEHFDPEFPLAGEGE